MSLNPDESFFIAGATKLIQDPVFWQSVDGATSGPLNFYALIPVTFFGLKIEYASARIVGLILVIIAVVCLYFSLLRLYSNTVARLAVVPAVIIFALITHPDYVHYTSEHLSIALTSLELLLFCQCITNRNSKNNKISIFLLGFLAGTIPFAKLQAVPIAAAMIAAFIIHSLFFQCRAWISVFRKLFILLAGCLTFPLIAVALLLAVSAYKDFWVSYIAQNLHYTQSNRSIIGNLEFFLSGWVWQSQDLNHFLKNAGLTIILLGTVLLILTFANKLLPLFYKKRRVLERSQESNRNQRKQLKFLYLYAVFFELSALVAVVKPGRAYYHYALFLIVPTAFLLGSALGEFSQARLFSKKLSDCKFFSLAIQLSFLLVNCFFVLVNRLWSFSSSTLSEIAVLTVSALTLFLLISLMMEWVQPKRPSTNFFLKNFFLSVSAVFLLFNVSQTIPKGEWIKNPYILNRFLFQEHYQAAVSEAILRHSQPGDSMAVLGLDGAFLCRDRVDHGHPGSRLFSSNTTQSKSKVLSSKICRGS